MLDYSTNAVGGFANVHKSSVQIRGRTVPVKRIGTGKLRSLRFSMDGREYQAIEQNPLKPSRWGHLAREGHQVVQFKDAIATLLSPWTKKSKNTMGCRTRD